MGVYAQPKLIPQEDGRKVGVIDTKTPERLAFETEQAIEHEGRRIGPS